MKALVLTAPNKLEIIEKPKPHPVSGEVLIEMKAAALNHRDQWIREGKYPGIRQGVTLGSDGAGIVVEAGSPEEAHWVGQEVVINPNRSWGTDQSAQSSQYNILGMPADGTFAEYLVVPVDRLAHKPAHLSFAAAASLPLAGLTAYRAVVRQGGIEKGSKVLVNGIGGGVAQFAFVFAQALGAQVWVSSGNEEKRNYFLKLGAAGVFDYRQEDWHKEAAKASGGVDVVIDSAGGEGLNGLLDILNPAGRLVFYGATAGIPKALNLHKIFWKQLRLQGTTMGNDEEFAEMLALVEKYDLKPVMEHPLPFNRILEALDRMRDGKQLGKLVVEMV
jgi:zinc-binding alcohol dehydrogenase/oxidoreductase